MTTSIMIMTELVELECHVHLEGPRAHPGPVVDRTMGSWSSTPSIRVKFTRTMRKARPRTPGPIQVGSVWVRGRFRPGRSPAPPLRAHRIGGPPGGGQGQDSVQQEAQERKQNDQTGQEGLERLAGGPMGRLDLVTVLQQRSTPVGESCPYHFSRLKLSTLTVS